MCYLGQLTKPKAGYLDSNSENRKDCLIFRRLTVENLEGAVAILARPSHPNTQHLPAYYSRDKFSGRISRSHRPLPVGKVQPQFAVFGCCLHETRLRVAHFPFRQLNRRGRIQWGHAELYELFGASDGNQLACSPSARAPPPPFGLGRKWKGLQYKDCKFP